MWPHCCPSFKWLRGGNLEVGEETEFLMKKYIILFFFQSPSLLSLPLTVGVEYLLHKREKEERRTLLEEEVVIESKKATGSFTCQVKNVG